MYRQQGGGSRTSVSRETWEELHSPMDFHSTPSCLIINLGIVRVSEIDDKYTVNEVDGA